MARLPGRGELRRLSLRAMVAYAVRCARRVQPLTGRGAMSGACRQRVDEAIALAEHFAAGDVRGARVVSFVAAEPATSDAAAARAADSAACAAYAAAAAADARTVARAETYADAAAYAAVRARPEEALTAAAWADYARLLSLDLGAYPALGRPIDCSDRGPLGPLWPDGPPTALRLVADAAESVTAP